MPVPTRTKGVFIPLQGNVGIILLMALDFDFACSTIRGNLLQDLLPRKFGTPEYPTCVLCKSHHTLILSRLRGSEIVKSCDPSVLHELSDAFIRQLCELIWAVTALKAGPKQYSPYTIALMFASRKIRHGFFWEQIYERTRSSCSI